jgi:hypothetical protein
MNRSFHSDSHGQMNQVLGAAIGVIAVFAALSLGMALVNNFEGNTTVTPGTAVPLKNIGFLAVAGVTILVLLVSLLKMLS